MISFDERSQALLWHVGDEVVEQAALSEQGMDAAFGGAGPQLAIHAQAFTGGAQNRQQQDGEGVEEQEAVAALGSSILSTLMPIPKRMSLLSRKLGSMVHLLE